MQPLRKTVWRLLGKHKGQLPCGPAIAVLGVYPDEIIIKKKYLQPYVQSSASHNSQDMETTSVSINRGADREDGARTYDGCAASKRNERTPCAAAWMQLQIISLSQVSHREKNKYHTVAHMCEISNTAQINLSRDS